jgi:hypothetical protein
LQRVCILSALPITPCDRPEHCPSIRIQDLEGYLYSLSDFPSVRKLTACLGWNCFSGITRRGPYLCCTHICWDIVMVSGAQIIPWPHTSY